MGGGGGGGREGACIDFEYYTIKKQNDAIKKATWYFLIRGGTIKGYGEVKQTWGCFAQ